MATSTIDYAALAKQAGAITSAPAGVDYTELAKKAGAIASKPAADIPDAGKQMSESVKAAALDRMKLDNPYNFEDTSGGGFLESAGQSFMGAVKGLAHLPSFNDTSPTASGDAIKDVPAQPLQRVTDQALAGNLAGAAGTVVGTAGAIAAPALVAKGVAMVPGAARAVAGGVKLPRSGTPVQRAAVDYALEHGAPLDAAAATLNPLVRGTQELAQTTVGASSMAQRAILERNEWYAQHGRKLADEVHPTSATPETAARSVAEQGVKTIKASDAGASDAYAALRERELDPKNIVEVQTGTKKETRRLQTGKETVPYGDDMVDEHGNLATYEKPVFEDVTRDVPVTEKIAFPVDQGELQARFKPVLAQLERQTRLGQSQYAPAQLAVEDLTNGPRFVSASIAEKNLGALKRVVDNNTLTGGVRNEAGGLASAAVGELQNAIDSAVKQHGGVEALNDLHTGRLKTAGKYAAIDLVDQFKAEPVKLFEQLTQARDGGIELLNKVQELAPQQMPQLGRAWLDGALDKATESGGFGHADRLFTQWQNLGDKTKSILFKNPTLISDLGKFFQSAKDSATVEGVSKTAKVGHITAQGALVWSNPIAGGGYIVAGNVISRLLYNPRFVRAAIGAMKADATNPNMFAFAAKRLTEAAGVEAVPLSTQSADGVSTIGADVAPQLKGVNATSEGIRGQGQAVPGEAGGSATAGAGARAGGGSTDTTISIPGSSGGGYKAQYSLKELGDLNASHSGRTFSKNPAYKLTNERDYANAVNQGKVVEGASRSKFDPSLHITDNPDMANGPLAIDPAGNVIGGNGRKMILDRVYAGNPKGAAAYRAALEAKAAQFGLDPAAVKGMKQPVLVREIPESEFAGPNAKQDAITDFNKKGTAELTPGERAISDSRRVSAATLEHVAARLDSVGANATVADVLQGKGGGDVLAKLVGDGVVSPQEQAAFVTSEGELTPAGKSRISALMVGRFFRDPAQLDAIAPSVRNQVERIAAPLAQVESLPDWNLTPTIKKALVLIREAEKLGVKNLDDYITQQGMFGKENLGADVIDMAHALKSGGAESVKAGARQYAEEAVHASKSGGSGMFGDLPTPAQSFQDAFSAEAIAARTAAIKAARAKPNANALAPKKN